MAKRPANVTRIYLDQYNLSGFLNASTQEIAQETIKSDTFSDAGPRRLVGNYDVKHADNGFFDGTDNQIDEIIDALRGSAGDHYLLKLFDTDTEGQVAYESVVMMDNEPRSAKIGDAVLLNHSSQGTNGVARGTLIRNATISGNGNGTGRNDGASTSGQTYQSVIRVISGTFTSFDVNVQESSDDAVGDPYATVAGLSQTGITTTGVWRKTTTSATEAYKRVNIANWNGTSAVVLVTVGLVKGT